MKRFAPAILLGLLAGFQGGLFGVGGGIVMVPGMVLFLGITQHRAHATSLAAMIVSSSAAVVPLALDNRIDWDTAGFLVVGAMAGAYLGARLFSRIPEIWLALGFVAVALASAVR
ncbi:MAG: sulfite exporter TauE/SafE family protein, partial [Actinobacteria bacterium]|nr:sulfite exporter TauE/SafE family protein [Actinomycetota bacterium]